MTLIVPLAAALLVGLLRGGSLTGLARAELRGLPWYAAAILLQTVVVARASSWGLDGAVYSASFLLLLVGAFLDRKVRGMQLVALGLALNAVAVMANGGRMPVSLSPDAPSWSSAQALTHVPMAISGRLSFLGDFIRIPDLGGHSSLVSPGDVLLGLGVFVVVQSFLVMGHSK